MADKDVYIGFGADTGGLEAAMARSAAELRALTRDMSRVAAQMQRTGAAADSDLGRKLSDLGERVGVVKARLSEMREAAASVVKPAEQAAEAIDKIGHGGHGGGDAFNSAQIAESIHVLKSLVDEVAAGQNPIRALMLEAGRIGQIASMGIPAFTAAQIATGGILATLIAAGGAMAYLVYQAHELQVTGDQLRTSSAFGGLAVSTGQADAIVKQLSNISGISKDEARKIVADFGLMQTKSVEVFRAIVGDIDAFAKAMTEKPADAAKKLIELFDNPKLSVEELSKALGSLSQAQHDQYEAALAAVNPLERQAALEAILAQKIAEKTAVIIKSRQNDIEALEARKRLNDETARTMPEIANAARNENETLDVLIDKYRQEVEQIKAANEEAARMPDIIRSSASAADLLRAKFDEVLKSVSGVSEAQKIAESIDTLRAGLRGATGDAAALIRQFEGFKAKAYLDSDGRYRVGYGSDTLTGANGAVSSVSADSLTTRADAERDLARRVAEFQAAAARDVGAAWAGLSDKVKASLTSVAYNYGSLPPNVAAAARGGDEKTIADAIAARAGDNGGVNASRRAQEAANITLAAAAVTDPEKAEQARDAIAGLTDKQRQLQDARNGGGVVAQAELRNLVEQADRQADAVRQAERLRDARQQDLDASQSVEERARAQKALEESIVELHARENAAKESGLRLDAARARASGSAAAEKQADIALADFKIQIAGHDVAARNAAEAEKAGVLQRYAEQDKALTLQTAQDRISAAQRETADMLRELDLRLKAHEITETQKLAATQAAYARQRAETLAAYQDELKIADLSPRERQRALDEISAAERQYGQRSKEIQIEAADASAKAWDSATKQVSSAIDGQISPLLRGTEGWASAVRNVLAGLTTDIVKFFVNWGVQAAANQAKQLALQAAGAASHKALTATEVSADAGKAASGAYAATAGIPLIGPILAPAAAAVAYAGTMAFSSFDIGAWSIPEDQLAMVHHGELVMPAAEAGAFRAMLSGISDGGEAGRAPAGGGDTHVHLHMSAIDGASARDFFHAHSDHIASAMHKAVRSGSGAALKMAMAR